MNDDDRTRDLEAASRDPGAAAGPAAARRGIESAFWAMMHNLFPAEARLHMKAAGREQLLAARAYLDHWIAKLDAEENGAEAPRETIDIS